MCGCVFVLSSSRLKWVQWFPCILLAEGWMQLSLLHTHAHTLAFEGLCSCTWIVGTFTTLSNNSSPPPPPPPSFSTLMPLVSQSGWTHPAHFIPMIQPSAHHYLKSVAELKGWSIPADSSRTWQGSIWGNTEWQSRYWDKIKIITVVLSLFLKCSFWLSDCALPSWRLKGSWIWRTPFTCQSSEHQRENAALQPGYQVQKVSADTQCVRLKSTTRPQNSHCTVFW